MCPPARFSSLATTARAGGDSFSAALSWHRKDQVIKDVRRCRPHPATMSGADCCRRHSNIHRRELGIYVEMREVQRSLARFMGDEPWVASLRSFEVGGQNGVELRATGALEKHSGMGAKASAFIGREARSNDSRMNCCLSRSTPPIGLDAQIFLRRRRRRNTLGQSSRL